MTTALEALQNARINFENLGRMGLGKNPLYLIAMEQLSNGIGVLEAAKARAALRNAEANSVSWRAQ